MIKAPRMLPKYMVHVLKKGCAKAAYEDVATFQSKVVIGLNKPRPREDPVRIARVRFPGAIQVIQLKKLVIQVSEVLLICRIEC